MATGPPFSECEGGGNRARTSWSTGLPRSLRDERFGQNEVGFISLSDSTSTRSSVRLGRPYKLDAFQKRGALAQPEASEASR
jgi:hypothetical protein